MYDYVPVIEDTVIEVSVRCRGSDSGACKGQEPGTIVPVTSCAIPTDSLSAAETIEKDCLTEIGANFPDEDLSDVLIIDVTVPETPAVGLNDKAPIPVDGQELAKLQVRMCFTPKFSTDKRAWRTNDS